MEMLGCQLDTQTGEEQKRYHPRILHLNLMICKTRHSNKPETRPACPGPWQVEFSNNRSIPSLPCLPPKYKYQQPSHSIPLPNQAPANSVSHVEVTTYLGLSPNSPSKPLHGQSRHPRLTYRLRHRIWISRITHSIHPARRGQCNARLYDLSPWGDVQPNNKHPDQQERDFFRAVYPTGV